MKQRISAPFTKLGLILQIDAPDLAMDRTMFYRDLSDAQFRQGLRDACGGDQQGDRRYPARPCAPALSAMETGKARTFTTLRSTRFCRRSIRPMSVRCAIEFSNPRHAARICGAQARAVSAGHDPHPRRGRDHQQLRRASRSGGAAHRGSGRGRSAIASASSPRPTAASAPSPAGNG